MTKKELESKIKTLNNTIWELNKNIDSLSVMYESEIKMIESRCNEKVANFKRAYEAREKQLNEEIEKFKKLNNDLADKFKIQETVIKYLGIKCFGKGGNNE